MIPECIREERNKPNMHLNAHSVRAMRLFLLIYSRLKQAKEGAKCTWAEAASA